MYLVRVKNDSVWQSLKILFMGSLVISKRTVEKHVENILVRLGLANRSAIILWSIENDLV